MATPTIFATTLLDKLDEFLLELEEHDQEINAGVMAVGAPAAYAEVWELGNVRQHKPGPKTVLGTNPEGEEAWLSFQAPGGYIRIHENEYWQILKDELAKVKFKSTDARGITEELQEAAYKAMKLCAQVISFNAPVDSGDLSRSFRAVKDGDPILDDSDDSRILIIGREE